MLSKRFIAWVGVGVLSVATIPALAAPHLARLASRKAPAATAVKKSTTTPLKATPAKAPLKAAVKTAPAAHRAAATPAKKTATKTATRTGTKTATKTSTKSSKGVAASHHTNLTHKATPAAHKPVATAKKATPSSTAKKLLH